MSKKLSEKQKQDLIAVMNQRDEDIDLSDKRRRFDELQHTAVEQLHDERCVGDLEDEVLVNF